MKASLILIFLVVMATVPATSAEILTVSQAEGDYATIQAALNASSDGIQYRLIAGFMPKPSLLGNLFHS